MKSESKMWAKFRPVLVAAKLDPIRVENPIHPGTPDVNLCSGSWIELKTIEDWPAHGRIVQIKHFTPQQRVFLLKRWLAAPGTTHLVLEVRTSKEWLLFDGDVAARVVGKESEARHREVAKIVVHPWELEKIAKWLSGGTQA